MQHHLPHSLHGVGWGGVEWNGVGMLTFPRPCSLDHAQGVDATLTWGGVGWDVNVPSTTFLRPCARCWCYAHVGWGGVGMLTFLRPCSLDHAQGVDATLTWGGVGWDVNVPSTTFPRPCARCWCHDHMGWGGDVITFLRPRSLDLSQDVDATLTWGGVGMLTFLWPRSLDLAQDVDATLT